MKYFKFKFIAIILSIVFLISVPGIFAVWTYASGAIDPVIITNSVTLGEFDYNVPTGSLEDVFEAILNNTTSFNSLKNVFVDSNKSVITTENDEGRAVINSIFGSNPTIQIKGETVSINHVLIQRANVDGKNTGADGANDYTLYLVVGSSVHVMTFNADVSGDWEQIGQMYEGTMSKDSNGNYDVSTWLVTQGEYTIGGYTYKVGQTNGGTHIEQLKTLEQLMSSSDDGLVNSVINSHNPSDFAKAYIIVAKEYVDDSSFINSTDPEKQALQKAYNALKKIKPYTNNVIIGSHRVEIKLQNGGWSRAEIISYLIAMYELMDTYDNVPYDTWQNNYNMLTFYNAEWNNW